MNPSRKYVLVTPARDEAATLGRTIAAVVAQTVRPAEWIIVSDGSTDGTNELVSAAADENPWIRLIALPPRTGRNFAAVVQNTELGVRSLQIKDYAYVGLLDADLDFAPDYFEQVIRRFEARPKLGLAGGMVVDLGQPKNRLPKNLYDIPGAVQFFRRECFESLGGLIAIPEGGWDALTCAVARMRGFETQLLTELIVDHLKPRNVHQGGAIRRKWQMGVRDYVLGYTPDYEFAKCLGKAFDDPPILAALAWWIGYCTAALQRRHRVVAAEIIRYIRREQRHRMRALLKFGRSRRTDERQEISFSKSSGGSLSAARRE